MRESFNKKSKSTGNPRTDKSISHFGSTGNPSTDKSLSHFGSEKIMYFVIFTTTLCEKELDTFFCFELPKGVSNTENLIQYRDSHPEYFKKLDEAYMVMDMRSRVTGNVEGPFGFRSEVPITRDEMEILLVDADLKEWEL
jgi:hypothetical protein